jgi:hypothetical protein
MGEAVSLRESDSATLSGCPTDLTTIDLEGLTEVPNKAFCKHGITNGRPEGRAATVIFSLMLPSSVSVYDNTEQQINMQQPNPYHFVEIPVEH